MFVSRYWSAVFLCAATTFGQQMISVRSGLIHYTEGDVTVDGKQVEAKNSEFSSLLTNQELRTTDGRAELLLTPGAFLRVAENSAIRMLSTDLSNTRVEVLQGSALVEVTELGKENAIAVVFHGATLQVEKAGLFRADSDPARLRVYDGQAFVSQGETHQTLTKGKEFMLEGDKVATVQHFDPTKDTDDLYRWSARRSSYVATANVALAKMAYADTGSGGCYSGCWGYNSAFGMYSYLPFGGMAYSPFGYPYWSPYQSFYAPYYYYPTGGYPGVTATSHPVTPVRGLPIVGGASQSGGYSQSSIRAGSGRAGSSSFSSGGGFSGHASGGHSGGHR
jgi:hypothetical protein